MSGLVNGLQNRLRRFESARDLKRAAGSNSRRSFCVLKCKHKFPFVDNLGVSRNLQKSQPF